MFRIEAAESDFRDEQGYPIVGGRCTLDTCNEHDFLPFNCRYCNGLYCSTHAEPRSHNCDQIPDRKGVLAVICRDCEVTLRYVSAESTEAEALDLHKAECKGKGQSKKEMCPVVGCKEVLKLSNTMSCPKCHLKVCMKHRFQDAPPMGHGCQQAKMQWLAKAHNPGSTCEAATARATRTVTGSGITGSIAAPSAEQGRAAWLAKFDGGAKPNAVASATGGELASAQALQALRGNIEATTEHKKVCLDTIRRLLQNVSSNPDIVKYRAIKRDNKAICEKILNLPGAEALLKGIGFQESEDGATLELPVHVTKRRIDAILLRLF